MVIEVDVAEPGTGVSAAEGFFEDADLDPVGVVDFMGEATEYEYDSRGLLTKIIQYDEEYGVLETVLAYDAIGRLVSEGTPGGAATQYTYTDAGKLETVTDAMGHTVYYEANPNGFVEETYEYIDNVKVSSYTAYNIMSQVASQADALGNTTMYNYDPDMGFLASTSDPMGATTSYTYNELGWMLSTTDALGCTTTYEYDKNGQTVAMVDPLGYRTEYG